MSVSSNYQQKEHWQKSFPSKIGGLISAFQMILTFAILGFEIVGIFIHFPRMNAFVGYWTFPFFTCASISLAASSCCCRLCCCGIATLIFQCLTILMSLCVIGFDAYFLNNPLQCFFSYTYCSTYYSSDTSSYYSFSNYDTLYSIKRPIVIGQLTAGALMFVCSMIYIFIFVLTVYRMSKAIKINQNVNNSYQPSPSYNPPVLPYNPSPVVATYPYPIVPPTYTGPPIGQVTCPRCQIKFPVAFPYQ